MNILLIGEYYSSNLGDGVICNSIEKLLINSYEDVQITVADISGKKAFSTNNDKNISVKKAKYTSTKLKLSKILTTFGIDTEFIRFERSFKSKTKYIEDISSGDYDLAIFAGGQMFKDSFVFPISKFIECLSLRNIRIIFNACGVGEIKSKKMRRILANSLSNPNIHSISSRDDINTLNKDYLINSPLKAIKTFDPAVWTSEVFNVKRQENNTVGLGIMYAFNMNHSRMVEFWKGIILDLEEKGVKWKFFCNGPMIDYKFAKFILDTLGYSEEEQANLLLPRPKSPDELVELISTFNSIISFRLHSHIIAYSLDIPGISIVWDEKIKHFYNSIGLVSRCKYISDSSSNIITEWEKAQFEGYDQSLRLNQKDFCKDLLVKMIDEIYTN